MGDTSAEQTFALTQGNSTQAFALTDPAGVASPEVGGPPVFGPGIGASFEISLNPFENQFLTMAIPSNDTFIATNSILGVDENGVVHETTVGELATLFGQPTPPFAGGGPNTSTAVDLKNLVSIAVRQVSFPAGLTLLLAELGVFGLAKRRQTQVQV